MDSIENSKTRQLELVVAEVPSSVIEQQMSC